MGKPFRYYKILLVFLLFGPLPCVAADTPAYYGLYQFDWNGLALGSLELGMEQKGAAYTIRLRIVSEGLVNIFTRHSSDTSVTGTLSGNQPKPHVYESNYKTKNKPRHIQFAYNKRGVMTQEVVVPPEDPTERPVVPHNLKDGSYDPLSGLLAIRNGARELHVFDGKRLYDVTLTPDSPSVTTLRLVPGKRKAEAYIMVRTPLGGLTAKETKEYKKGEPPLTFYMSADDAHIPLGVSLHVFFGVVHGMVWKECASWDSCKP